MVNKALSKYTKNIAPIIIVSSLLSACGDRIDHLSSAKKHYKTKELNSAIVELRNALKIEQNNFEARKLLGKIYFQQGDFLTAEKELEKVYQLQSANPQVVLLYAEMLLKLNNFERFDQVLMPTLSWTVDEKHHAQSLQLRSLTIQSEWEQAAELVKSENFSQPKSFHAIYAKAMFQARSNELQQSQDLVTSLLEQNSNHIDGLLLRGDLQLFGQDYENALLSFQKAGELQPLNPRIKIKMVRALLKQEKLEVAANILTKLLKRSPLFHEANYYYSHVKLQQKNYELALEHANKVLELIPDHKASQYVAASAAYFLKRYETSYRLSRRLVASLPDNNAMLKLLASNQLNLNLHGEAIATLNKLKATELQKQDAVLFFEAAKSLSQSEQDQKTKKQLYIQAAQAAPSNQVIDMELASLSFALGSIDEGNKHLLAALAKKPASSEIKIALILSYLQTNQLSEAQSAIEQLIAAEGNRTDGYTLYGLLHLKRKKNRLAEEAFKQALSINPNDPNANHNLAVLAIISGDFSLAKQHYLRVVEKNTGNLRALTQLSLLEKKLNNDSESIKWLEQAAHTNEDNLTINITLAESYIIAKKYQSVIDQLEPLGKKFVKELRIPLLLGQAYYLTKQYKPALTQFSRATALDLNAPTSYFWSAIIYEKLKDFANARDMADKALTLAPEHKQTLILALRLSLTTGKSETAEPLIGRLLASYPDDVLVKEFQAKLATYNKDYKEAISLFTALFEQHETNYILIQLADALVKDSQTKRAYERLTTWLSKYPEDLLVLNLLANELIKDGQLSKAKTHLSTLVELTPDNAMAQNNLAWLLYKEGDLAVAQTHVEHAYRVAPESTLILDTFGQILLAQGNYSKSEEMLKLASNQAPDNLETKYYLAKATALNGDKFVATSLLQQILSRITPKNEIEYQLRQDSQRLLTEMKN